MVIHITLGKSHFPLVSLSTPSAAQGPVVSAALCFDMIRPIRLVISCDSAVSQSYLIKDSDGDGIDFYVLPTPLISKISLELVKKKVRQHNFSG